MPLDSKELEFQYDTKNINYVDLELSYDHFSDANWSIFQNMKREKIGFKVMAQI